MNYNTKDIFLERRTSTQTFEEYPLHVQPNSVLVTDINGNLVMVDTSSFIAGTGSIHYADSASIATTASYLLGLSESASYSIFAETASFALNVPETASLAMALNPGANIYLSQSYIYSNISASAPSHVQGQLWWDAGNHTYTIDTLQSRLQIGQENYVRAIAGEYIPNGTAVYLDGVQPDPDVPGSFIPVAYLAIADGTGLKSNVVGVSTQELFVGNEGFITTQGIVHEVNTGLFLQGNPLYLSATESGSFTDSIPQAPYEKILIGTNLYSHASDGRLLVNILNVPSNFAFVGPVDVPTISNTGSVSGSIINVGGIGVRLCETADGKGAVKNYMVPSASFTIVSPFLDVQNLIVSYNGGTPHYEIVTNLSGIDDIQSTPVATFTIGTSGALSYVDWDSSGILLANKLNHLVISLYGAQRATGLILEASSSHITLTAGTGFLGVKELTFTTASTENTRQFVLLGHSASIWSGSFLSGWVNDRCDNGTDLVPLDNGKYVVNYVFRGIGSQNRSQVILSPQYNTYGDAVEAVMPEPPAEFSEISILCGRIIAKEGDATAQLVESSFTQIFSVAGITHHNNLNGLQGGIANQYYHLTSTEYAGLGISASYAKSASYLIPGNPVHLTNSYIQASTKSLAPAWQEGRLFWDKVNHTYAVYNDKSDVTLQLGQENFVHVMAGENIANGKAVYIDGPIQDPDNPTNWMPKIYKALADTSATPGIDKVAGLTTHTFTSGSAGWITTTGVIHDVDTSAFTPGAILYLSSTELGGYQEADPGQPFSTVEIGTVIHSDVTNGSILVKINVIPPSANAYAGMTTIPTISNNNNGTVTVSTGSVNLYGNPSGIGAVTSYNIPETTLTLISGSTNYITTRLSSSMVEGEYYLTTDATYANGVSIVRVGQLDIYTGDPAGTEWDVHQFTVGVVGLALANRLNNKDIKLYGFQRQSGLTLYTTGSGGQFGITDGTVWYGPNSHIVETFDTTLTGYYTYIFHTSGSGWHQHTSSIYLNGVYDNGAGSSSLTPVPETSWSVNFVYRIIGTTDEAAIVMSNNWYATELEASNNASTPPNLPSTIRDQCLLIGRFIVQSGSYASTVVESAFSNVFLPAVVTDHESLLGLQGGQGGEHYHLTLADYNGSGTGVMIRSNKPSFDGATPYHIPYWNTQQQLTLTGSVQVYLDKYVVINSASITVDSPEALLVKQTNTSSVNTIGAYSDVNEYSQIYNQNFSSGSSASTDIVATADNGTQSSSYVDMGIASSQYSDARWPWLMPNDAYLENDGGDLWVATLGDKALRFAFNNTASTNYADKTGFYLSGSLFGTASHTVSASYVPDLYPQTYQESASWASASISASYVPNLYPQTYQESASWASASISASYAISASYVPNLYPQVIYESSSWASASFSSSYANTASYALNVPLTASNANTASYALNVPLTASNADTASFSFTASYTTNATTANNANTASYVLSSNIVGDISFSISSSWASSSISSSHAITASYVAGIPTIKSGIAPSMSFNGDPLTASIVFTNPFPNTNYSVAVVGGDARTWVVQNQLNGGFEINSNSNVALTSNVFWQAITTGEFYS